VFAVQRNRSGGVASLVIPFWAHKGAQRCFIYEDGNRLAFALGERGDYLVNTPASGARSRSVVIPAKFAKSLPYGTHDISYSMDGDMIVIDLAPLMLRVAAE
jgi:hypothetical protein